MTRKNTRSMRRLLRLSLICCLLSSVPATRGQEAGAAKTQEEEVVRVSAELVQTDVMVFDKAGKFVEGLKPEQFELRVDGKAQPFSFFEQVAAGTFDEEAQLAAARGRSRAGRPEGATVRPLDRGRSFIFFLDDVHIAPGNLPRTRDTLLRFVEQEMGQNDEAAIFTTTGQLGFLQQMTSDKSVLRIAVKRLAPRFFDTRDNDRTPMSEFQALAIERNDRTVFDYFVDQTLKEMALLLQPRGRGAGAVRGRSNSGGGGQLAQVEGMVRSRARNILTQSNVATGSTLTSLENVVRRASALPGRKILFFISDGFFINVQSSSTTGDLLRIAGAAARSGTVIYSLDSHGLSSGIPAAGDKVAFDTGNRLGGVNSAAPTAAQEPLYTLAADTGGRALFDANDQGRELAQSVKETSHYYLLAWRPEGDAGRGGKFRSVEVAVKDRPELVVRVRKGFSEDEPQKAASKSKSKGSEKKSTIGEELMAALKALYPRRALPTALFAGFTDAPGAGATLTASVEVDAQSLGFGVEGVGDNAALDVMGAVVNDEGKAVSEFEQNLIVVPTPAVHPRRRRVVYNHQLQLKPGLYQVRVAARDRKSGRAGSAMQWIEVPDLKKSGFSMSSVFIGETGNEAAQAGQLSVCADHRFARSTKMGFLLYVYNAARATAPPDVALQVQIFRDDQPVVTKPLLKIDTGGVSDLSRLSYGEELSLDGLPAGRYVLHVTAIDRTAKASASQRINFIIE